MGKAVEEYTYPNTTPAPTTLTDKGAGYGVPSEAAPPKKAIKCTYCKDSGYIWVDETPDTGHEYQANCPVCNPKIDLYAADRYESDF